MVFEKITSIGLSHYSYFIADEMEAVVIDPRIDGEAYLSLANQYNAQIKYVLETHRHEDFLVGSIALSNQTGAEIWHADSQFDYAYGYPVIDKQTWKIGKLKIESFHTPGHTPGSMSYLLYDEIGAPYIVFTGDVLFAGGVGRVDLMGANLLIEMASDLYDSIFNKILLLGDHIIVCPAHGQGTVCGQIDSDRTYTTVGLERLHNRSLQFKDQQAFTAAHAHFQEKPPYFNKMVSANITGDLPDLKKPLPLSAADFYDASRQSFILDTRDISSFATSHTPGALSIWHGGVSSFAGWYIPYNRTLFLIAPLRDVSSVTNELNRLGFIVEGYLGEDFVEWHIKGLPADNIQTITAQNFHHTFQTNNSLWILDVRSNDEFESQAIFPSAHHIHITQLPENIEKIPVSLPVYIICNSGRRSMIAASFLKQQGPYNPVVILGGYSGLNSLNLSLEKY